MRKGIQLAVGALLALCVTLGQTAETDGSSSIHLPETDSAFSSASQSKRSVAEVNTKLHRVTRELPMLRLGKRGAEPSPEELPEELIDPNGDELLNLLEEYYSQFPLGQGEEMEEDEDQIRYRRSTPAGKTLEQELPLEEVEPLVADFESIPEELLGGEGDGELDEGVGDGEEGSYGTGPEDSFGDDSDSPYYMDKRPMSMLRLGKRPMSMLRLGKRPMSMLRLGKRPMSMLRLGKRPMSMLRLGKRPMSMLRLGKRPMSMLRLGKRPMSMLRLGKRPMSMLRLGKRPMSMLRLGKRPMSMLRLGKRPMSMLRLGKRPMSMLRLGKRPMSMLRLGKRSVSDAAALSSEEGRQLDVEKRSAE